MTNKVLMFLDKRNLRQEKKKMLSMQAAKIVKVN